MRESKLNSYILMIIMIITGACNTIILSLQFSEESLELPYFHPWFQTQNLFIGESYCLIIYYIYNYFLKRKNKIKKQKIREGIDIDNISEITEEPEIIEKKGSFLLMALPAFCDFLAQTLLAFALLNMATSVFQMLQGGLVIITAILSVIFLERKIFRHHILGLILISISLFSLGLGSMIYHTESDKSRPTNLFGISLLFLSLLCTGIQLVLEEKFIADRNIHPLKVVGLEGFWGSIYYIIVLPILQNISCDKIQRAVNLCTINDKNQWSVEDSIFAIRQIIHNKFLIFLVIISTLINPLYSYYGVCVTKFASSLQRAVSDNIRMILIWIFFISVPTKIKEKFIPMQLFGFIGLIIGTLIYSEIIVIPCFDFDKYIEIEEKEISVFEEKVTLADNEKEKET